MALLIQDKEDHFLYSNTPVGVSNRPRVTVRPSVKPFFELVDSLWVQDIDLLRTPPLDDDGNWSISLPWPSESNPSTVSWAIVRTDGTVLTGKVPEGALGPVSLEDLVQGHGWGYGPRTVAPTPSVPGPRGINWRGPWSSSTQYGIGDAVYYQNATYIAVQSNLLDPPPSVNWNILVSVPSTYDASQITSGTLSLARLSGITHSQLDASAGILGSQIHDVPSGLVTGLLSPSQGALGIDLSGVQDRQLVIGNSSGGFTLGSLQNIDIPDDLSCSSLTISTTAPNTLTPFVRDTFTLQSGHSAGENLSAHTGELGTGWIDQLGGGYGTNVMGANGKVRLAGTRGSDWWYTQYVASGAPSSPNYRVQADIVFPVVLANDCTVGVHGRVLDSQVFYAASLTLNPGGDATVTLARHSLGGWAPQLGNVSVSITPGTPNTLALILQGTQLSVQLDGVTLIGPVIDTNITDPGQAGFEFWVDTGAGFTPGEGIGPQLDNFTASQLAPPAGITLIRDGNTKMTLDADSNLAMLGNIHIDIAGSTDVGLIVKGSASQSADLQQWQDSTGAVLAEIISNGNLQSPGILTNTIRTWSSGTLLCIPGTAGWVPFTIQGVAGQTADLLDLDISHSSTTYPATLAFTNLSAGKAWRAFGTYTDVLQGGYGQCMQVVSYYPLQLWGHAQNYSGPLPYQSGAFSDALPAPSVILNISEASDVGLVIKGFTNQAADLQQWQTSIGGVLASIRNDGALLTNAIVPVGTVTAYMTMAPGSPITIASNNPSNVPAVVKGAASQTADLQEWQDASGNVVGSFRPDGYITLGRSGYGADVGLYANGSLWIRTAFTDGTYVFLPNGKLGANGLTIDSANISEAVVLTVKGGPGQTADLQHWHDNNNNILANVDASGSGFFNALTLTSGARITSGSGAPSTPGGVNPTAGDMYFRRDTPNISMQRIYCCVTGGASPVWVGIA